MVFPLHEACSAGDRDAVIQLLASSHYAVDVVDDSRSTGLHWACANNRHEVVQALLDRGADPLARNCRSETPLHVARTVGAAACLSLLSKSLVTPRCAAAAPGPTGAANEPLPDERLLRGVFDGIASEVRSALLGGAKCDMLVTPKRASVLHLACAFGQEAVARVLIDWGCNVAAVTDNRTTALMLACSEGHKLVVQLLLAQPGADPFAVNDQRQNCLHLAAMQGRADVVALLLRQKDARLVFGTCRFGVLQLLLSLDSDIVFFLFTPVLAALHFTTRPCLTELAWWRFLRTGRCLRARSRTRRGEWSLMLRPKQLSTRRAARRCI